MATVNTSYPTLLDQIKRTDPDGSIAQMVEYMSKRNAILEDAVFQEGNLPTGTRITSRTALPSVGWRKFNEGVTPGKSLGTQVDETAGMLEGMSVVDTELARLNGNEAAFRMSEDMGFTMALNNEVETGMFYHSTYTAPEKFHGLAPRFNATTDPGGSQIVKVDAAASGSDQTSIWLVGWSPQTVFCFYPKGMTGGIETVDMGKQLWDDGTGKKFTAYVTNWKWKIGLAVKDWRYVVRLGNIDTGSADPTADTLIPAMIQATYQMLNLNDVRPVFYMNRTAMALLHKQARSATKAGTLSIDNIGGKPVTSLLGIPIRVTDSILNTEAALS